jgi:hypothetical protein
MAKTGSKHVAKTSLVSQYKLEYTVASWTIFEDHIRNTAIFFWMHSRVHTTLVFKKSASLQLRMPAGSVTAHLCVQISYTHTNDQRQAHSQLQSDS